MNKKNSITKSTVNSYKIFSKNFFDLSKNKIYYRQIYIWENKIL